MSYLYEQEHAKPFDVSEHLSVSEELGEVDVEDVAGVLDHDVVVMTITDAEDVRRDAVASAACREVVHRLNTARQSRRSGCHKKTNPLLLFGRPLQVTVGSMLQDRCPVSVMLVYCGQMVGWIKMSLGTEVGLSPDDIVLDGDSAPPTKSGTEGQ